MATVYNNSKKPIKLSRSTNKHEGGRGFCGYRQCQFLSSKCAWINVRDGHVDRNKVNDGLMISNVVQPGLMYSQQNGDEQR